MNIQISNKKIKDYFVILAVYIEDNNYTYQTYGRKYYMVTFEDSSRSLFLTTNETDYLLDISTELDEEYIQIDSLEHMLDSFEKSELIPLIISSDFKGPPKYIFYEIATIDDRIKPFVLEHLKTAIEGYEVSHFSQIEWEQINKWRTYLTNENI